jgi:Xaa-Pro aminopeptidase
MGFRYFPIEEYEERWKKVYAEMARRGHETALIWGKTSGVYERSGDMLYLTNFFSTHSGQEPDCELWNARGFSAVILRGDEVPELHTDEAEPRLDIIATDRFHGHYDVIKGVADALIRRGIEGPVAIVGTDFLPVKYARQLEEYTPNISYVPDDDLVRDVRRIKSPRELDCFREGGEIVTRGLTALMEAMIAGKTEGEAAAGAKVVTEAGGTWHRIPISHGATARYLESFEEVVQRYFDRWDRSMPEDDAAVERQHLGLRSRIWSPGRLSWAEPVVHMFDNWVLDRVL